jgi:hypothetical protein
MSTGSYPLQGAASTNTNVEHFDEWRVVIPSDQLANGNDLGTWVHWSFVIDAETGHNEIFRFGRNIAEGSAPEPNSYRPTSTTLTELYMLFGNALLEGAPFNGTAAAPGSVVFAPFDGLMTDVRVWGRALGCGESVVADYW